MNKKLILLLLLALLLPATAAAHDIEVDGIYYNINGNEATVTYKGTSYSQYSYDYSGSVTIPSTVTYNGTTYSVTAIGSQAFYGCRGLTSVNIPNSVTSIGNYAFCDCSGLTSVNIPNSVTSIGDYAFMSCSGLTSIIVDNGNPNYDSRNNCNAIIETASNTLIAGCMNTVIPNSVTSIGYGAFLGCSGLTSIDIPNSVTIIGEGTFFNCSGLTTVNIPNSVISIGAYAFCDCSGLTSIDIPNSVTIIDDQTFWGCSGLTSITFPNSVISIGAYAFCDCSGLTSVNIPNSVTSIGDYAFMSCSGISSVTIGNSVTHIGDGAFCDCPDLTDIYILALMPPIIQPDAIIGWEYATLYVSNIAVESYQAADYWVHFTNIVGVIFPGTTFVVDGMYYRVIDANAVSVIANEEVETLYTGDMVVLDSVTYEGQTFAVTSIESNAFDGCYELTSVVIPNSVESIGEQAFQGCTGLTRVTIGSGVTAIGAKAFNYCNALATVKCIGTVPPVMASSDCFSTAAYNRATLLVPRLFIENYQAADYWYKFASIEGWGSAGPGDVDGDGSVTIKDATSMIDVMLGGGSEDFYFESSDFNNNGRVDIADVVTLIDYLLNGYY